ncbi:MAG: GAF domain-containing protein [Anaerolineales bacterium]|nr:GAF domain-containing protein [Anaerolineales bacterium]
MSSENLSESSLKRVLRSAVQAHSSIRDAEARRRAELAAGLSLAMIILTLATAGLASFDRRYIMGLVIGFCVLGGVAFLAYLLSRSPIPAAGAILLTISPAVTGYILVIATGDAIWYALSFTIPLTMLLATILFPFWAAVALALLNIGITLLVPYVEPNFPRLSAFLLTVYFVALGSAMLIVAAARNVLERRRLRDIQQTNAALVTLQENMEQHIEERTRQVRTAAQIAQRINTTFSLEDLLKLTSALIVEQLGHYQAEIFLVDETGRSVVLRAVHGPAIPSQVQDRPPRLDVGAPTLIGWVTENKRIRLVTSIADEPLFKNDLLPETQAKIGLPILHGDRVLGALAVYDESPINLNENAVIALQTVTAQLAAAIQNIRFLEAAQGDVQGVADVYQTGFQIARAQTEAAVVEALISSLRQAPYVGLFFKAEDNGLRMMMAFDPAGEISDPLPEWLGIPPDELASHVSRGMVIEAVARLPELPSAIHKTLRQLNLANVALLPVFRTNHLAAILILGTREGSPLLAASVQPFASIVELTTAALERVISQRSIERRLAELESITVASQAISSSPDLDTLYRIIHEQVRLAMGEANFLVAIYDEPTNSIQVPYRYEGGEYSTIEAFPLGEGLTSILIRTKQPLMIVEDTEKRLAALGARIVGKIARSWLGAPMIVAGASIGAIIVQDTEKEKAFTDNDLRLVTTLAAQVAGAIYNVRLLEETRRRAVQLHTAAEIARDISGSLDVNEILVRAVSLVRDRFNFYHAAVFLVEAGGEFAVIREATGEAGVQMKRAGHKLGVGSKSLIGYVSSSGEPLIVNDTAKDTTYFANPLLPDTRSEIALPLKVGARTLGVLDVQSIEPYAFSEEDINVLRILADQLAVAVLNSELFAETQEHLSQHRLLHHVTTAAASGTTLDEALTSAAQGLQVTLGGDRVTILLVNPEKRALEVKAIAGYSDEMKRIEVPIGSGVTGWVAAHLQPLRIDDVTKDNRYYQVDSDTRSELAIPLLYRGEILGVLNVESDQVAAYSENDEEMLGTLGGSLAAIIANARLLEQIRHQVDRERLLYEVTSKIRRSTDTQAIMETTTSELSKALGAHRARIKLGTPSTAPPATGSPNPSLLAAHQEDAEATARPATSSPVRPQISSPVQPQISSPVQPQIGSPVQPKAESPALPQTDRLIPPEPDSPIPAQTGRLVPPEPDSPIPPQTGRLVPPKAESESGQPGQEDPPPSGESA